MKVRYIRWVSILLAFALGTSCQAAGVKPGIHLDQINLPANFAISLYADNVPGARSLFQMTGPARSIG